jgi:ribonuclease J
LQKLRAPIYATSLTMGFIEYKLEEFDLLESTERHTISTADSFSLGPFKVSIFSMCHSIADGIGLAVQSPAGILLHSGDFKLDPTPIDGRLCDLEKIAWFARQEVLALFSDSTNVERKGSTLSESMIRPAFEQIFREARGRILIATFSSNIHRIQQVLDLCVEFGRKAVLVGRSMAANARIAADRGFLKIPDRLLVDMKDLDGVADRDIAVLSTGSQGEPMSALSLMASDRHKFLKIKPGDVVVFSSRFIPGNERAINHIINEFSRKGARVMYEKVSDVHVSGHASQEELRYLIRLVKPKCFIPIHGEYRHLLKHAQVAQEEGVPPERTLVAEDGDLIEFNESGPVIADQLDVGKVFVHGKGVGDIGHDVLKERRTLAETGIVVAALVIGPDGRLAAPPVLQSRGVTYDEIGPQLLAGASSALWEALGAGVPRSKEQWEDFKDEIRLAVRRQVNRTLGRKPLVETIIVHLPGSGASIS